MTYLLITTYKRRVKSIFFSICFLDSSELAVKLLGHTNPPGSSIAKGIQPLIRPPSNLATTTAALSPGSFRIMEWEFTLKGWRKEADGGRPIII